MSYTTRCPACGTTFRVVPDQLKISDGWVRCGHCADVFDATLYLEQWTPPPAPAPVLQPPPTEPASNLSFENTEPAGLETRPAALGDGFPAFAASAAPGADEVAFVPEQDVPATSGGDDSDAQGEWLLAPQPGAPPYAQGSAPGDPVVAPQAADASGWSAWEAPSGAAGLHQGSAAPLPDGEAAVAVPEPASVPDQDDFHAELARFAAATARAPAPAEAPEPSVPTQTAHGFSEPDEVAARQAAVDALGAPLPATGEPDPVEDIADEPGFMRQARRQAFWRTPGVRAAMALIALLLGALLAGQWAVHERDRLAASRPELAPWLAQLCQPLGCSIGPLRHIDAVVIDSSTLARRLGNFYAFDVVLKNTAALPLAVPALELSLTDTRDQVIARRVFLPQDLPGAPALLPAQASVPLSLRLSITDVGPVPMAGYRALVFYP